MEARANSGFYRVLLKLLGMLAAAGSQGYILCIPGLAVLRVCMGFRYGPAVFILVNTHCLSAFICGSVLCSGYYGEWYLAEEEAALPASLRREEARPCGVELRAAGGEVPLRPGVRPGPVCRAALPLDLSICNEKRKRFTCLVTTPGIRSSAGTLWVRRLPLQSLGLESKVWRTFPPPLRRMDRGSTPQKQY